MYSLLLIHFSQLLIHFIFHTGTAFHKQGREHGTIYYDGQISQKVSCKAYNVFLAVVHIFDKSIPK